MRRNWYALILLLAGEALTATPAEPGLLGRFLPTTEFTPPVTLGRTPANEGFECRRDLFTVSHIRAEAEHYESQQPPLQLPRRRWWQSRQRRGRQEQTPTSWRHLDFANLPAGQARFLIAYGNRLGDLRPGRENDPDISGCQDVPCVISRYYGSSDGLEGWAIYLWYLKMGNFLAVNNAPSGRPGSDPGIYRETGTSTSAEDRARRARVEKPLSDYLFTRDELYVFWRVSHLLPESFRRLPHLKEIQRMPRGVGYPDAKGFSHWGGSACAISAYEGYLQMVDGADGPRGVGRAPCMNITDGGIDTLISPRDFTGWNTRTSDQFGRAAVGNFYTTIVHELAHQLDFEFARQRQADLIARQSARQIPAHLAQDKNHPDGPCGGGPDMLFYSSSENWRRMGRWTENVAERRLVQGYCMRHWRTSLPPAQLVDSYASSQLAENFAQTIMRFRLDPDYTYETIPREIYNWIKQEVFGGESYEGDNRAYGLIRPHLEGMDRTVLSHLKSCQGKAGDCLEATRRSFLKEALGSAKANPMACEAFAGGKPPAAATAALEAAYGRRLSFHRRLAGNAGYVDRALAFHESRAKDGAGLQAWLQCVGTPRAKECFAAPYSGALGAALTTAGFTAKERKAVLGDLGADVDPAWQRAARLGQKSVNGFLSHFRDLLGEEGKLLASSCSQKDTSKQDACLEAKLSSHVDALWGKLAVEGRSAGEQERRVLGPRVYSGLRSAVEMAVGRKLAGEGVAVGIHGH